MPGHPTDITPERPDLKLGFIPLIDCCPLAVAREMDFFDKHGLNVTLCREVSWANIRDKVSVGELDGAHMLAGMPIATTLGLGFPRIPMLTAFSFNLNGNAITVSNQLHERLLAMDNSIITSPANTARALHRLINTDRAAEKAPLTFAMVYPFSNHNYQLRYWMAAAGIDPDRDIRLVVIPPQYMIEHLRTGQIDGYCVGEPWNTRAVMENVGKILITGYEIWNNAPEKVLGVTREWAMKYPSTHLALIRALLESSAWADNPENAKAVAEMLADEAYVGVAAGVTRMSLANVFHRYQANFPWRSHAVWIISQMYRWGQLDQCFHIKQVAEAVYRPDIYRRAAEISGLPLPTGDYKVEGNHPLPWLLRGNRAPLAMGSDTYTDGMKFDPDHPVEYIQSFPIHNMKADIDRLAKINSP